MENKAPSTGLSAKLRSTKIMNNEVYLNPFFPSKICSTGLANTIDCKYQNKVSQLFNSIHFAFTWFITSIPYRAMVIVLLQVLNSCLLVLVSV